MTTSLPPRARIAFALPRKSGTVQRLPFDTAGFAPRITSRSVRAMSGTGIDSQSPNIRPLESCFGIWSSVEAENRLREPSARANRGT